MKIGLREIMLILFRAFCVLSLAYALFAIRDNKREDKHYQEVYSDLIKINLGLAESQIDMADNIEKMQRRIADLEARNRRNKNIL